MKNVPFKRFLVNRNGGMWGSEPGSDEFDVLCIRVADFDYENLKTKASASTVRSITEKQLQKNQLHDGDILLEKSGGGEKTPVGRAVYYSGNDDAICSNFIERLTVNQQTLNPKFACYILSAAYSQRKNLDCIKQTTGIQNLSVDDYLSSVTIPLFDIETQKRITKWLDKQLSKVAQVITAKQAQLQKLSTYRQSLITRAVTKGLDPNVDCMKNVPFKRFIISRNGGMWGSEPGSAEVDALCIRVADFDYANLKTRPTASTMRSISEKQLQNNQLRDGDILLEKSGGGEKTPVGRAVYYSGCEGAICSNFIERLTINRQMLNPKFACYVLSSAYSQRKNFDCIKQTTGIQNLSVDDYLSSVTVPLFDLETQQRITNWLDKQLSKVAQVITANQAQLMKLTAYRQSLISYAVTGQLAIEEASA